MIPKCFRPAAIAAALLLPTLGLASPVEEAKTLMASGQHAAALEKLDTHLRRNAQDAEGRFLRGLVLVQLERTTDAIRSFADLTRDYPQLPEPYNNLAVLYAQEGDYEKARDALEAALATHPSYATAHENLGDIYAALAGAAYNRALLLDQANQGVRNKLSLIGQLDSGALAPIAAAPTAPAAAITPAEPVASTPVATRAPEAPTPTAAAEAPAAASAPAAPTSAASADRLAAELAIRGWARAWSTQDLTAYFFAYSRDFVPEGGLTRAAWETQRRDRISRPGRIAVNVSEVRTEPTATGLRASFIQAYESDNFSDTVTKTLDLVREDGNWKIVREFTR